MSNLEKNLIACGTNFGYCLALQAKIKKIIQENNLLELPEKFPLHELSDQSVETYLLNLDGQMFEISAKISVLRYEKNPEEATEELLQTTANLREALEEELRFFGQKNIQ